MSGPDGLAAGEIRRAVEASPRNQLHELKKLLWRALAEERVSEAEAEAISARIEEREVVPVLAPPAPRRVGSRPRTDASLERRRRWVMSGRLPPGLGARFTSAEAAVLSVVAAETARRGDCRLAVGHVAALAGVSRSTVKNALREARRLGLVTIEERKLTGFRNATNIVRIVSPEWQDWNRLVRGSAPQGGGVKSVTGTPTIHKKDQDLRRQRPAERSQGTASGRMAGPPGPGRATSRPA